MYECLPKCDSITTEELTNFHLNLRVIRMSITWKIIEEYPKIYYALYSK